MKLQFAVFTGSSLALPVIDYLNSSNQLAAVVVPDGETHADLTQLHHALGQSGVPVIPYSGIREPELMALLDRHVATAGLAFFFRYKLSPAVIDYFSGQIFNLHPGRLPDYRGPCPVYWQLRNGESRLTLTVHRIEQTLDSGEVGWVKPVSLHPFDTYQSAHQKVAQFAPAAIAEFVESLQRHTIGWSPQPEVGEWQAKQVTREDLTIDWRAHSAQTIVDMARAGNPVYGGAMCDTNFGPLQLLQATKYDKQLPGVRPGTITEVSLRSGLIIQTCDGSVSLDVVSVSAGVLDGYRWAQLCNVNAGTMLIPMTRPVV